MPEPDRILRIRAVLDRTGLRRSTLYRKIADGSFPRQVRISRNGCGWRESAISAWVADPTSYTAEADLTFSGPKRENRARIA
jgi:prophage regulatory protein